MTNPFYTGPKPEEIAREAAATGQTVAEVAKQWGVPVPEVVPDQSAEPSSEGPTVPAETEASPKTKGGRSRKQ